MAEALDNIANERTTKVENEELRALLSKVKTHSSLWVAFPGSSLKKMPIDEGKLKDNVNDVVSVSGGIVLTDDIKIEFAIAKSSPMGAREAAKEGKEALRTIRFALLGMPSIQKVIDTIKITVNESTVNVESHLTAEFLSRFADGFEGNNEPKKGPEK